ncbi:uncharacterized protein BJ171DRAFT_472781 [Polychytrium aggregatum]|uniref:uncharacterized protein n=1 Tax=Polychytrium aggregatum TaxID=110093 RepID=UPI0022FED6C1|nr:uncharacterized protein BJ171DRAFT_472775 [Polychytrium aggregatum]XP_052969469.1 uncharacterized protein BJ171DRAFT_472781 [Polychytrium aggregatum]KAI9207383.1 hypothetical protein BJ171DRAFT_472775 [Polychytrium aggregatum]KAI9207389.1 hypothetical protein BJ171DRAFT_472781 [Polychytrium aggregatum]
MDAFDEFLGKADLAGYKSVFLDNECNTVDLLLALKESDMKDLGMKVGGIKRLLKAQADHGSAKPVAAAQPVIPAPKAAIKPPVQTMNSQDYTPVAPAGEWRCQLDYGDHDVFISTAID